LGFEKRKYQKIKFFLKKGKNFHTYEDKLWEKHSENLKKGVCPFPPVFSVNSKEGRFTERVSTF
jgi:hypothetical protein